MNRPEPPTLALWLLTHCRRSPYTEALAGDLIEEFHKGRTSGWLWRQVVIAVLLPSGGLGRLLGRLLRAAALITVGAGTLTWASTVREGTCHASACAVHQAAADDSSSAAER